MKMLLHWVVAALAIGVAAYMIPGVSVTPLSALIGAVVLGGINLLIRPILFFLTLPITILTLGLFSLVLNALMVLLAGMLVPGFSVAGFWSAFFFAIVLAVVNWVFDLWKQD